MGSRKITFEDLLLGFAQRMFLDHIYLLAESGKTQAAAVSAIDYVDHLLNLGLFGIVNDLLLRVELNRMPSALRRAFLMVTHPAKHKLPARAALFQDALSLLAKERDPETAKRMLKSLA